MDQFNSIWQAFGGWIFQILPLSPFQPYIQQFAALPYLGYLNWFFPIGAAIQIMKYWLTVIGLYFTYQWILRWIKVIQ